MTATTEQVIASALALPESERMEIVQALLDASEPPPLLNAEAWRERFEQQKRDIAAGLVEFTPWDEGRARVHARLGLNSDD